LSEGAEGKTQCKQPLGRGFQRENSQFDAIKKQHARVKKRIFPLESAFFSSSIPLASAEEIRRW
jgi:hypothetical protein